jgi:hypothetical protein
MQKKMPPRRVREEIESIDRTLGELQPWEKRLTAARKRYVLLAEPDVVDIIEEGLDQGAGRPADPDLEPFDRRWPGLHATREAIADLKERRALFVEQLPSKAQTVERQREAEALAIEIRKRASDVAGRTASVQAALNETAGLALALAEDTWRLFEDNAALDKLTADADIARAETPRVDAVKLPLAAPLGLILRGHFHGAQPYAVDENAARQIHAELVDKNVEPEPAVK